jgi:NAD(P)-dependent dehydrogenase (short-subunit alcohol dehydrogenase family)
LRILCGFLILLAGVVASSAPAQADDPFPASGAAKLAAYAVCRSLAIVDMGPVGSNSSAECTGIVKTRDGSKLLDNLAIRCLEEAKARPEGYAFTGTCTQTDGHGDKLFMTYEGPEGGDIALLGGTGKYKDIAGKGTWSVADAPGNNASLFAFTLSYDVSWTTKEK